MEFIFNPNCTISLKDQTKWQHGDRVNNQDENIRVHSHWEKAKSIYQFQVASKVFKGNCFFKIFLEDTSPFCGATDTPVLDFWWRLPWVSKLGWIPHLHAPSSATQSWQWVPQIHLWCNTCRPLYSQHGSQSHSLHAFSRGRMRCFDRETSCTVRRHAIHLATATGFLCCTAVADPGPSRWKRKPIILPIFSWHQTETNWIQGPRVPSAPQIRQCTRHDFHKPATRMKWSIAMALDSLCTDPHIGYYVNKYVAFRQQHSEVSLFVWNINMVFSRLVTAQLRLSVRLVLKFLHFSNKPFFTLCGILGKSLLYTKLRQMHLKKKWLQERAVLPDGFGDILTKYMVATPFTLRLGKLCNRPWIQLFTGLFSPSVSKTKQKNKKITIRFKESFASADVNVPKGGFTLSGDEKYVSSLSLFFLNHTSHFLKTMSLLLSLSVYRP